MPNTTMMPAEDTVIEMQADEVAKVEAEVTMVGAAVEAGDSAIDGGKAAVEGVSNVEKAAGQLGEKSSWDKCGHLGPFMSLLGDMFQVITAPVAGPAWVIWLYIFMVLGVTLFFIVNFVFLIQDWATTTVTEVNLKWEKELAYPDIYMCIPAAVYYHAFKCCGSDCTTSASGGSDPYAACGSWGFLGLAGAGTSTDGCQSFGKFSDFSRHYRADSCPYTTHVGASFPSQRNYYLENTDFMSGLRPKVVIDPANPTNPTYGQFPTHTYATALEDALPTFTPAATASFGGSGVGGGMTGITQKSVCYYFQVTDAASAKAVYGAKSYLQNMFVATMTDALMRELPHLKIYLMPQGQKPTDATGVRATEVTWPALAMKTIGDITIDKYKDTTKGETEFTFLYSLGLSSQPVIGQMVASMAPAISAANVQTPTQVDDGGTGAAKQFGMVASFKYGFDDLLDINLSNFATTGAVSSNSKCFYSGGDTTPTGGKAPPNHGLVGTNLVPAYNALTISNFVVREIVIRNRTVAEYWAAIGGLFAGSLMILSLFFAASGVSHNNRPVQTFNFADAETQEQWLEPYQPEDKMAELEKRLLEKLTAKLAPAVASA